MGKHFWRAGCLAMLLGSTAAAAQQLPPPADAPTAGSAQGDVSVTIYNNDVALVQDVRQLPLGKGQARQNFPDVSAAIRPETVSLVVPDAAIVEQNFDYDLLSPSSLMEKAVGETITLVRTNPATGAETRDRAKVLAVNGGVVIEVNGHVEVLRDDGLPVRVVFDKVPDALRARPTLSVTLASSRVGTRPATLSYLSRGLGWSADYVALFDDKNGTVDMQGWVTLKNTSGTTFSNAKTLLVAGEVGSTDDDNGDYRPRQRRVTRIAPGTESAAREQLGDFYLYPLTERTTIADKQTKQVSFLDAKGVAASSGYRFENAWLGSSDEPRSAQSVLRFRNSGAAGMGGALPAGVVRVYARDARGQPQFIGENRIEHTPQGSTIALPTGDAFDVKIQPTTVSRVKQGDRWRTAVRYKLTNARSRPATVELIQGGLDWGDVRVVEDSAKGERRNAGTYAWQVPVPANGSAVVTATFDTRY